MRAVHVGLDRSHGTFHNQPDAHCCSQVRDDVSLIHQFREKLPVLDRLEKIMHPVEFLQMADILHAAGGQIVHQQDFIATFQQALGKMGAHEASPARNQMLA